MDCVEGDGDLLSTNVFDKKSIEARLRMAGLDVSLQRLTYKWGKIKMMQGSLSRYREQLNAERDRLQHAKRQLEQQVPPTLRQMAAINAQLSLIQQLLGPELYSPSNGSATIPPRAQAPLFVGRSYPKWWTCLQYHTPSPKIKRKFVKRRFLMGAVRRLCAPRSRQTELKAQ